jgi:tetratricopeptide (TPR) repeat protein
VGIGATLRITVERADRLAADARHERDALAARAARRAETARLARPDLDEATRLWGRAQVAPPGDLVSWQAALEPARRAQAILDAGEAEEDMRQRTVTLLRALEAGLKLAQDAAREAARDRLVLQRVEAARFRGAQMKQGALDRKRRDREFAAAFREYGIDLDRFGAREASRLIAARPIKAELIAALDNWQFNLGPEGDPARATQLLAVTRALDRDPLRNRLRNALESRDRNELRRMGADPKVLDWPPGVLHLLADALFWSGESGEAVACLRRAWQRHPNDFVVNFLLTNYLVVIQPPRSREALGFGRAAVALSRDNPAAHLHLGVAQMHEGMWEDALNSFRRAAELDPDWPLAHLSVAMTLVQLDGDLKEVAQRHGLAVRKPEGRAEGRQLYDFLLSLGKEKQAAGKLERAEALYRTALEIDPASAGAHTGLGFTLLQRGDVKGARAAFAESVLREPKEPLAQSGLGTAALLLRDLAGAEAAFKAALRHDPRAVRAHVGLGRLRYEKNDLDGAIASCKQALAVENNDPQAHHVLGKARFRQVILGRGPARNDFLALAVASLREAARLDRTNPEVRLDLGSALALQGPPDQALAAYREAIRLRPDYAEAHCFLGNALVNQGQLADALAALREGHHLGSRRASWPYPSEVWVRECELFLALERRLPAILKGNADPADAREHCRCARLCRFKGLYAASARLYEQAFAKYPGLARDLVQQHRFRATGAAALAGCGRGEEKLPDEERAQLRRLALSWLRADLGLWKGLASGDPRGKELARRKLGQWFRNPDLAGLREKAALDQLPEAERAACRALWADAEAVLALIEGKR